jgi:hypothetical protein
MHLVTSFCAYLYKGLMVYTSSIQYIVLLLYTKSQKPTYCFLSKIPFYVVRASKHNVNYKGTGLAKNTIYHFQLSNARLLINV